MKYLLRTIAFSMLTTLGFLNQGYSMNSEHPTLNDDGFNRFFGTLHKTSNDYDHETRLLTTFDFVKHDLHPSKNYLEIGDRSRIGEFLEREGVDTHSYTGDLREALQLEDSSFDGVFLLEILPRIKDLDSSDPSSFTYSGVNKLLGEIKRVLKPGGKLFLSTPNASSADMFGRVSLMLPPLHYHDHVREYTKDQVIRLCQDQGLVLKNYHITDVWNPIEGINRARILEALHSLGASTSERGDDMIFIFENHNEDDFIPIITASDGDIIPFHSVL